MSAAQCLLFPQTCKEGSNMLHKYSTDYGYSYASMMMRIHSCIMYRYMAVTLLTQPNQASKHACMQKKRALRIIVVIVVSRPILLRLRLNVMETWPRVRRREPTCASHQWTIMYRLLTVPPPFIPFTPPIPDRQTAIKIVVSFLFSFVCTCCIGIL